MNINVEIEDGLSAALVSWYPFEEHAKILVIGGKKSECVAIADILRSKGLEVYDEAATQTFDYIVAVKSVETAKDPESFLNDMKAYLKPEGKLLFGAYNRFAVRNFFGDKDPYSGHVFDGIDGYRALAADRLAKLAGRCYSKAEIENFLSKSGFVRYQTYSVMPALERPQILLRYGYKPNEALDVRLFPQYTSPESVFLEEELIYDDLLANGMFHQMANAYLFECSIEGKLSNYDQITVQGDRSPDEAMATLICDGSFVEKRAIFPQSQTKLESLIIKNNELKAHGIPVVDAEIIGGGYRMPFVKGKIATLYLRECMREGRDRFLEEIYLWKSMIENSSEHVAYDEVDWTKFEPGWEKRKADDPNILRWEKLSQGTEEDKADIGVILKHGYLDMVSINCFHTDQGYSFFDQEFYLENFPANSIIIRTIDFVYRDCAEMQELYPKEDLLQELNLFRHADTWRRKGNIFLEKLRNEVDLLTYHKKYRRDWKTIQANRHRMNYSQDEYERLFKNIFKGADNKQLYLFGSGIYSEKFIDQFGQYYNIAGVLDNNSAKWGSDFHGIPVMSPYALMDETKPYKVFICIKYYEEVLSQLKQMGVNDISIYEHRLDYQRPVQIVTQKSDDGPKPYHIGYVAGVFDVFHIGHLNLLRRAKEQCDYLIAGVVSDEQVIKRKKTKPYMNFEDRREIVAACKYVDEAVKIPVDKSDTEDAWRMYHFDAQFSGSDYENDPYWLAKQEFLRQHGSNLVFFPYTESTSSTKLKAEIGK